MANKKDTMIDLRRRLVPDTYQELRKMIIMFDEGRVPAYPSGMEEFFVVAKEKSTEFCNHAPVLAISFGGSNTKLMLASMRNGHLEVEHLRAMNNPSKPIDMDDFFDILIRNDPVLDRYLKQGEHLCIGISVPMPVINACPYHPSKIPTLHGMIARSLDACIPSMQLNYTFDRYLRSRGYDRPYRMFYQSDGIVAHHGAVSLFDMGENDKSVLCICGTGMANGDERHHIPISMSQDFLPRNDRLFPCEETEGYQLNYAITGKGLFSLMRRAITECIREGGSSLQGRNLERYFQEIRDTKTVFEIWQTRIDASFSSVLTDRIRMDAGEEGYTELQELSEMIVERLINTLANAIVATFVSMGPVEKNGKNILFFEGSIANNTWLNPLLQADVLSKASNERFFSSVGKPSHPNILMNPPLKPLVPSNGLSQNDLSEADITLMGSATMAIAYDVIESRINHISK